LSKIRLWQILEALKIITTQVPGESAQYNGWTGAELLELVHKFEIRDLEKDSEIERLKAKIRGLEKLKLECWTDDI
jgi:hypothetical protein